MSLDPARIERVVAMAQRLIAALEADIAALKAGQPQNLRTTDPEIQRLTALYGRDAAGIDPRGVKTVAAPLCERLVETTKQFRETLARHARLVARLRNASEGMIRAIADEVDRRRAPMRTYGATPRTKPRAASAMIVNSVV